MFDALVIVGVLSVFTSVHLHQALVLLLVTDTFFLLLLQFKLVRFDIFAQSENMIRLLLNVSLSWENITFSSGNLFSGCSYLTLDFVGCTVLVCDMVSVIIKFLLETMHSDQVWVVASFEVIIFEQLFVLKMTIFGLNGVELIAKGKVIFVTLLNFENLCFELADK